MGRTYQAAERVPLRGRGGCMLCDQLLGRARRWVGGGAAALLLLAGGLASAQQMPPGPVPYGQPVPAGGPAAVAYPQQGGAEPLLLDRKAIEAMVDARLNEKL